MFTFFFWVTYAYTNITKSLQTRLAKKKKKSLQINSKEYQSYQTPTKIKPQEEVPYTK